MKFILFVLWTVAFFKVEGQSRPRSRDEMSIMEIVNATAQLSEVRIEIYYYVFQKLCCAICRRSKSVILSQILTK